MKNETIISLMERSLNNLHTTECKSTNSFVNECLCWREPTKKALNEHKSNFIKKFADLSGPPKLWDNFIQTVSALQSSPQQTVSNPNRVFGKKSKKLLKIHLSSVNCGAKPRILVDSDTSKITCSICKKIACI